MDDSPYHLHDPPPPPKRRPVVRLTAKEKLAFKLPEDTALEDALKLGDVPDATLKRQERKQEKERGSKEREYDWLNDPFGNVFAQE